MSVDGASQADGAEATPEGEDDEENEVRMSTMRVRVNAMRIDIDSDIKDASDDSMPGLQEVSDSEEEDDYRSHDEVDTQYRRTRLNVMWDGGDGFDDYFCEYQDDYWNGTDEEDDDPLEYLDAPESNTITLDRAGGRNEVEYRTLPMGIRVSPAALSAIEVPLPQEAVGTEFASDPPVTENDDCQDCETHGHTIWECEDCCSNNTRVVDRVFFDNGDICTRCYIECDDCGTIVPFDVESHGTERLGAARIVHSSNIRRRSNHGSIQPIRDPKLQAPLVALVEINGVKAFTLFDTGSTTDSVTPEFAFATRAKQITLEDQVILQLGCVGSRSKINYGTRVPVNICGIDSDTYFDLVNLDRYDCIIGTPFMNTHGVCLDFGNRTIRVNGRTIPAFTLDEEQAFLKERRETAFSKKMSRLPPRETKPITKMKAAKPSSSAET
jgi:hypothetical protein